MAPAAATELISVKNAIAKEGAECEFGALCFYTEEKMPYFHVQINQTRTSEFVVNAPNREEAENIAMNSDALEKFDNKKIVPTQSHHSSSVDSVNTNKTAWTDALKHQKDK